MQITKPNNANPKLPKPYSTMFIIPISNYPAPPSKRNIRSVVLQWVFPSNSSDKLFPKFNVRQCSKFGMAKCRRGPTTGHIIINHRAIGNNQPTKGNAASYRIRENENAV